jgi:hypothetical protein
MGHGQVVRQLAKTSMTQEQSMQQVYMWVQREKENSLYMCTKCFQEQSKVVWITVLSRSHHEQTIKYHRSHVLQPCLHTYIQGDEKTEPWIPKCATWVPIGPHWPEAPNKWARPARSPADLQSRWPWNLDDLIQIADNLLRLWSKILPRSRLRRRQ